MKTTFNNIDSMSFHSEINNISKVESLVETICEKNSIQQDCFGNILIAVTEAVNNAIIHGNQNVFDKKVTINTKIKPTELIFEITDEGSGFPYENLPDPTAPENIEKENGRGIFLMRALADKVDFENNGSKVTLAFSLT